MNRFPARSSPRVVPRPATRYLILVARRNQNPIRSSDEASPFREFVLGALLLSACFISLCAYASYQRKDLVEHATRLTVNSAATLPH